MRLKTTIIFFSIFFLASLLHPKPISAKIICEPIYGGGERCRQVGEVWLGKKVQKRNTNEFYFDLDISNPFYADDIITFQISVKNESDGKIDKIKIHDKIPDYTEFFSGPGTFDQNTREIYYEITDLGVNEERTNTIMLRVVPENRFANNILCLHNNAKASVDDDLTYADQSQFCLQKKTLEIISPATGANYPLYFIALLIPGLVGIILKKKMIHCHPRNKFGAGSEFVSGSI